MTASVESQVHPSQFPVIQALAQHLERARQQHLTGSLNFDTLHLPRIRLFFVVGRLVWASGGLHRFRRWQRLLKQFCPGAMAKIPSLPELSNPHDTAYWEYEILGKLVDGNHISREAARAVILANLIEVLFDIAQASKLIERFSRTEACFVALNDAIAFIPFNDIFIPLESRWRAWCVAHLGQYSPNLSPTIAKADLLRSEVQPQTYESLTHLLQGELSLRELALLMEQDLCRLSQSMIAYEQQGIIELRVTPDLTLKGRPSRTKVTGTETTQSSAIAKIFCVDDSPTVCQQMGKTLTAAGYSYSSTLDPVKALQMIIEEQPDLIFIDLVMPVVSGYELCSQVRRIDSFKETPIIIFSGNVLDKLRAKMLGANQVLGKPIPHKLLLSTVETSLNAPPNARKSFRLTKS